jgi:hypothetical protein
VTPTVFSRKPNSFSQHKLYRKILHHPSGKSVLFFWQISEENLEGNVYELIECEREYKRHFGKRFDISYDLYEGR